MKTMSQVLRISDCPETLDEARKIIDELDEKNRQLSDIINRVRSKAEILNVDGGPNAGTYAKVKIKYHLLFPTGVLQTDGTTMPREQFDRENY